MSLFQVNPAEEGLFADLTVKNLCWGQNCDLVLFGSKKMTQFAKLRNSQLAELVFITSYASVTLLVLTEPCEILFHVCVVTFMVPGLVLAEITVNYS